MSKEINWENIPKLNEKQLKEIKDFVDNYGEIFERNTGKSIDEDFIRQQVEKNYDTYNAAYKLTEFRAERSELTKAVVFEANELPEGFVRGLHSYLTEDKQKNQKLAESLLTKDGRQAFVNRVVKDLMSIDISAMNHDNLPDSIQQSTKNCFMTELSFVSLGIHDILNDTAMAAEGLKLEEPLKTAFEERYKILETANKDREKTIYAGSPMGLLFDDKLEFEQANAINTEVSAKAKELGQPAVSDAGTIMFLRSLGNESPGLDYMKNNGMLNNFVHITDKSGKLQTLNDVKKALDNGNPAEKAKNFKIVPKTPKEQEKLSQQLASLTVEYTPSSYEQGKIEYQRKLNEAGIFAEVLDGDSFKDQYYIVSKDRNGNMKLQMAAKDSDAGTGDFHDIEDPPREPKRPGLFKQLLHSINRNLFKSDFDKYDSEKTIYNNYRKAMEKLPSIGRRLAAREENVKKQKEANRIKERDAKIDKALDSVQNEIEKEASIPEASKSAFVKFAYAAGLDAMKQLKSCISSKEQSKASPEELQKNVAAVCLIEKLRVERDNPENGTKLTDMVNASAKHGGKLDTDGLINAVLQQPGFRQHTMNLNEEELSNIFANFGSQELNNFIASQDKQKLQAQDVNTNQRTDAINRQQPSHKAKKHQSPQMSH